jgi:hypothetical protein
MLGTLAKWLRILGFDAEYINDDRRDEELIELAKKGKVLITRDKLLLQKAGKKGLPTIAIESDSLNEQLKKVIDEQKLEIDEGKMLTRCTICNELVIEKKKEEIKDRLPKRVLESNDKFWECPKCKRVYWIGSHWNEMEKRIKEIMK